MHCPVSTKRGALPWAFTAAMLVPALAIGAAQQATAPADTVYVDGYVYTADAHDTIEPAGYLAAAGAPLAYGSDWPVDPLNEWFALKGRHHTGNRSCGGAQVCGPAEH